MARLTADMVTARTRQSDIGSVKKLNCWGSELVDVSILRNMPSVEILALSLNKIARLEDFEECWNLQELYLRKNNIPDLSELCYLQNLPHLKSLWLDENPCANVEGYRMMVLKALPKLQTLDNIPVTPEEVQQASSRSRDMYEETSVEDQIAELEIQDHPHSNHYAEEEEEEEEDSDQQNHHIENGRSSHQRKYSGESANTRAVPPQSIAVNPTTSRPRFNRSPGSESSASPSPRTSPRVTTPDHQNTDYQNWRRSDRSEYSSSQWTPTHEGPRHSGDTGPTVTNQVVGNHLKGFHRRPVARNSNLLSAVLCLVKELDYQSLEVLELAVRCRMDEIAD